jgi:hypothetical protein
MGSLANIAAARDALVRDLLADGVGDPIGDVNWTYDVSGCRVDATQQAGVIVMGFNAGSGGRGSEMRWKGECERLTADIEGGYMLAELILISSHDIGDLRQRQLDVGRLIARCAAVNMAVIAYHRPRVILQTGLGYLDAISAAYGLKRVVEVPRPDHPRDRLLRHHLMSDGTPWLSIKHPSSFGFSRLDLEAIRSYVRNACGVGLL